MFVEHIKAKAVDLPDPLVLVVAVKGDQDDHQHVHCLVQENWVKMYLKSEFELSTKA